MFSSFPSALRSHGINSDARTLIHLYTLMSRGLVRDLGGVYSHGERLVVKDPREKGPYTIAFFAHFLDIHITPGQTLDDAVMHSDAFNNWRHEYAPGRTPSSQLVDEFLDSVLNRAPDLKGMAANLLEKVGDPLQINVPFSEFDGEVEEIDMDHSDEELAELVKKMQEIAEEQKEVHNGGRKYIGAGGTSPYGHNGKSSGGIRVGGRSAHLSARMVLNDARFFPVDLRAILTDNNVDAALAALKGVSERTSRLQLDIQETIRKGAKRGGLFLPEIRNDEDDRFNIMIFIDNGGFSMDPHIPVVRTLFQKMKTRFSHDLQMFYFHNIIEGTVYRDEARRKEPVLVESLLKEGKHQSVFIVGDASMAPYELHSGGSVKSGFDYLREMAATFPRLAWLNPVPEGAWYSTETIGDIRTVIKMFALTPRGIEKSVEHMNRFSPRKIEEK